MTEQRPIKIHSMATVTECESCGLADTLCQCSRCAVCSELIPAEWAMEFDDCCSEDCLRREEADSRRRREARWIEMQRADAVRRFALVGLPDEDMSDGDHD